MRIQIFLAVFLLLACTAGAFAQTTTVPEAELTCDPAIQTQMKQQGWLEGQRDMEVAQRLILKPDSTLEYTCFKQEADNWSARAGTFTNNGGGTNSPTMKAAIDPLVQDVLLAYLNNFGHLFLGGTYKDAGASFTDSLNQPDSICNPQYWIWSLAKCVNISAVKDPSDGHMGYFFPLSKLASRDVRDMPLSCPAPYRSDRDTQVEAYQMLQDQFPDVTRTPPVGVANASRTTGTQRGQLYSALLSGSACAPPVMTGFKVKPLTGEDGPIEDGVCITPGCAYINGSCQ